MDTLPISLPFEYPEGATAQVHVLPWKVYGDVKGSELFKEYGSKVIEHHQPKPLSQYPLNIIECEVKDIEESLINATPISFCVQLTREFKDIRLGGNYYSIRAICHIIETIQGVKLISVKNSRPLRNIINSSIQINGYIYKHKLILFGRHNKVYVLKCE